MTTQNEHQGEPWLQLYRFVSLTLSVIFFTVGLVFLAVPLQAVGFFNAISLHFGLPEAPTEGASFFLILAVAYMYLVSMLAFMMFRNPENPSYPWLLISGKSASSIVSLLFIIIHGCCLIYIVNAITDGSIALGLYLLNRGVRGIVR
jgi:hypothetical protein